jgi:hypothetical protein
MRPIVWFLLGVSAAPLVLGWAGLLYVKTRTHGFSVRAKALAFEKLRRGAGSTATVGLSGREWC